MKKEQNIEKLFQDKFSSFEPKVNPNAWNAINSELGTNVSGASATTSVSKTLVSSFFAVTTIVFGVVGNTVYNNLNSIEDSDSEAKVVKINEESTFNQNDNTLEITSVKEVYQEIDNSAAEDKVISDNIENIKSDLVASKEQLNVLDELLENEIDKLIQENRIDKKDLSSITFSESTSNSSNKPDVLENENALDCSFTFKAEESDFHSIQFTSNCSDNVTYNWSFDDGESSFDANPRHYFNAAGTYQVTLEITDRNGSVEKHKLEVKIVEPSSISKVPNVFTPNGDNHNDYYFIESSNISDFEVTIIDRKGQVVFESKDENFKWNGNDFFGEPVAEGGYVCVIKAVGNDGKKHTKTTSFALKR